MTAETGTTTMRERRAAARSRAAAIRERDEVERATCARLVAGVCAGCGGLAAAGRGTLALPNPWMSAMLAHEWARTDSERATANLPPLLGWRRRCEKCAASTDIVASLTGIRVAGEVAGAALGAVRPPVLRHALLVADRYPDAHRADVALRSPRPQPWAHVTEQEREALARAVRTADRATRPTRCVNGACGFCGMSTAISWRSSPLEWADGAAAPLCAPCAAVWDRRGRPGTLDADRLRAAALEALSGANSMSSDGLGIRLFVDVAGDDHSGKPAPWTYAPDALDALRERARLTWPSSLPPDLREEYTGRALRESNETQTAARAAAAAERAAADAEHARAAGWIAG